MRKMGFLEFSSSLRGYNIYHKGHSRPIPKYVAYHGEDALEVKKIVDRTTERYDIKAKRGWENGELIPTRVSLSINENI